MDGVYSPGLGIRRQLSLAHCLLSLLRVCRNRSPAHGDREDSRRWGGSQWVVSRLVGREDRMRECLFDWIEITNLCLQFPGFNSSY